MRIDERQILLLSINAEYRVNNKLEISLDKIYEIIKNVLYNFDSNILISKDKLSIIAWAKFYGLEIIDNDLIIVTRDINDMIEYLKKSIDSYYIDLFVKANQYIKDQNKVLNLK